MKTKAAKQDYFIGLDLGTNSIGWAVTDTDYNLLKANRKYLWGVRLFDTANTAAVRRLYRAGRRRNQRKVQRLNLLREIFEQEIIKIDKDFFARLKESSYHKEDRFNHFAYPLFDDKNFTDIDYYKKYPTIFHLRSDLVHHSNKNIEIRELFLAINSILKTRGHFLFSGETMDNSSSLANLLDELKTAILECFNINLTIDTSLEEIGKTLKLKRKTEKKELLKNYFIFSSDDEELENSSFFNDLTNEIYIAIASSYFRVSKLFNNEEYSELSHDKVEFDSDKYETRKDELEILLTEEHYRLIEIFEGYGWYQRVGTEDGAIIPQGITEFGNTAMMVGQASVNFSNDPYNKYDGFWGATSTYASFSYLAYGMLRLYSQMDQDNEVKVGKALFVAGHSGPETADDSRTHFGIFSPAVMQLFPKGSVINLYPWEYNEVPVLLASALKLPKPSVVVLHLTRPAVEIPDRKALKMASHFEAAKGAYIVRDFKEGEKHGTLYVQGTSAMANIIKILAELDKRNYNMKIVYVASPQLFELQNSDYQNKIISEYDKQNSTLITTSGKKLMPEFTFSDKSLKYALSPDWDDRWRTGGTLEEVLDEAHLSPEKILEGIERFVASLK
jgi:hypothetical protein